MSTYPRDEFDAVPESPRRQGVHRTRSTEPRRGLAWIMAAGIAALMIGAAAFFLMPRLADTSAASGVPAPSSAAPSADATPSPAQATPSAASSTEAATSPATTAPTAAATAPAGGVNRALEVGVFNSTGTPGLAARVGDKAKAAGWAVASVGNWSGSPMTTSVVFYRDAASAASARALAADLGIPTILEAPGLGIPLAAVAGPGYVG